MPDKKILLEPNKILKIQRKTVKKSKKELELIDKAFGSAPNAAPFKRDHKDRFV